MEDSLRKKINLLVNLAKSDGSIHVSEAAFIRDILKAKGVSYFDFDTTVDTNDRVNTSSSTLDKQEVLYWCLQLIKADDVIHPDEVLFCKSITLELEFDSEIIDKYAHKTLPDFELFKQELE